MPSMYPGVGPVNPPSWPACDGPADRGPTYSERVDAENDEVESVDPGATPESSPAEVERSEHGAGTVQHDQAVPEAYARFMRTGWGDRDLDLPPHPVATWAADRRQRLTDLLPGERLVVPAGTFK